MRKRVVSASTKQAKGKEKTSRKNTDSAAHPDPERALLQKQLKQHWRNQFKKLLAMPSKTSKKRT